MENGDLYFNLFACIILWYTMIHYLYNILIFNVNYNISDFICDHQICYFTHN